MTDFYRSDKTAVLDVILSVLMCNDDYSWDVVLVFPAYMLLQREPQWTFKIM